MRLSERRIFVSTLLIGAICMAGLTCIRFISVHPSEIAPLGIMIGMTPLVVYFAYCPSVPGLFFFIGSGIAIVVLAMLMRWPPHPASRRAGAISMIAGRSTEVRPSDWST